MREWACFRDTGCVPLQAAHTVYVMLLAASLFADGFHVGAVNILGLSLTGWRRGAGGQGPSSYFLSLVTHFVTSYTS